MEERKQRNILFPASRIAVRALPSSDNVGRDTLTVMCRAADIQPIQPESSVAIPAAPSHTVPPPRRRRRRLSKNARVLLLAGILFSFITVTQYVAALAAHSLALAVDCASMLADTISYSGNLLAECAPARLKQRLELVMSAISLLLLFSFTLFFGLHAISNLDVGTPVKQQHVDATIILVFALLGSLSPGRTGALLLVLRREAPACRHRLRRGVAARLQGLL